jgi:2-polyprenyl-3-methyl-5-hydroxy-6-metoxy-1,4-benzoquinol methylase
LSGQFRRRSILKLLRCSETDQKLRIDIESQDGDEIITGMLTSEDGEHCYPIIEGVPRFVPLANYSSNFGIQWNRFRQTQLDSFSGHPISHDRFWEATEWQPGDLIGEWVLDAGCGAGRFAEIALHAGAKVVAIDYSTAVDACRTNLIEHPNLHVIQGDIYKLPVPPEQFLWIYSLGVLQHTPDVKASVSALAGKLAPGGHLVVDYYQRSWKSLLHLKYWLRPITKRIPADRLFVFLQRSIPVLLPVSNSLVRVPKIGQSLKRLLPIVNYHGTLPLSREQHKEWSLLDTFDWLAPAYDNPQSVEEAFAHMEAAGLQEIVVTKAGHLVARAQKAVLEKTA